MKILKKCNNFKLVSNDQKTIITDNVTSIFSIYTTICRKIPTGHFKKLFFQVLDVSFERKRGKITYLSFSHIYSLLSKEFCHQFHYTIAINEMAFFYCYYNARSFLQSQSKTSCCTIYLTKNRIKGSKFNLNRKFRMIVIKEQCVDWKKNLS